MSLRSLEPRSFSPERAGSATQTMKSVVNTTPGNTASSHHSGMSPTSLKHSHTGVREATRIGANGITGHKVFSARRARFGPVETSLEPHLKSGLTHFSPPPSPLWGSRARPVPAKLSTPVLDRSGSRGKGNMTNQPGANTANTWYSSCPRCRGSRYRDGDIYGEFLLCLACGHVTYPFKAPERRSRLSHEAMSENGAMQAPPSPPETRNALSLFGLRAFVVQKGPSTCSIRGHNLTHTVVSPTQMNVSMAFVRSCISGRF